MALLKVITNEFYKEPESIRTELQYIMNPLKTWNGYIGAIAVFPGSSIDEMVMQFNVVKGVFCKEGGIQLIHFVLSFAYDEGVSDYQVYLIGYWAAVFFGERFQTVYAVHQSTEYTHIHFVMNSVSWTDGQKFTGKKEEYRALQEHIAWVLMTKALWCNNQTRHRISIKRLGLAYGKSVECNDELRDFIALQKEDEQYM